MTRFSMPWLRQHRSDTVPGGHVSEIVSYRRKSLPIPPGAWMEASAGARYPYGISAKWPVVDGHPVVWARRQLELWFNDSRCGVIPHRADFNDSSARINPCLRFTGSIKRSGLATDFTYGASA